MSGQIFSCLSYIFAVFVDRSCVEGSMILIHIINLKAVDTDEIEGFNIFMFYFEIKCFEYCLGDSLVIRVALILVSRTH